MADVELDARTWAGLEYLESISGPGAIAELVEGFVHDAPRRLVRMKAASEAGEWEPLQRLAHDLKSNCATVGALQLSLLAAEIERTVQEGRRPELAPLLEKAGAVLPRVLAALEEGGWRYPAQTPRETSLRADHDPFAER